MINKEKREIINKLSKKQKKLYKLFTTKSNKLFKEHWYDLCYTLYNTEDDWFINCDEKEFNLDKVFDAMIQSWCTNIRDEVRWIAENEDELDLF